MSFEPKTRGQSTRRIAEDMKLSSSSLKHAWMHWTKTKMQLYIGNSGQKKASDEELQKADS